MEKQAIRYLIFGLAAAYLWLFTAILSLSRPLGNTACDQINGKTECEEMGERRPLGTLIPVRALIEPSEMPPREVGAYGLVAFTAKPLYSEVRRARSVCEAIKAVLIPQTDLWNTPLSDQMITYWPITNRTSTAAVNWECDYLVAHYHLKIGLDAIRDADMHKEKLATKKGPFLIAWSPAKNRHERDAIVLIIDLSNFDSEESFVEIFKQWRQQIVDDPKLWRNGWNWEAVKIALRDTLDRYGESVVKFVKR